MGSQGPLKSLRIIGLAMAQVDYRLVDGVCKPDSVRVGAYIP
jgi:hypothetical protein